MTVLRQGFRLHKRRLPNVPAPKPPAPVSFCVITSVIRSLFPQGGAPR